MTTKYYTVWTPSKISDFVTEAAVNNGGKVIKEFDKQCDAVSYANSLNNEAAGHYCVMIKDEA